MLRPHKGEGERRKSKGPQLLTATLLFMYPVCLAQTANANASALQKPSYPLYGSSESALLQQQGLLQRSTTSLGLRPLGANSTQGVLKYPFTSLPSYTSQDDYQSQLQAATDKLNAAKAALAKSTRTLSSAQSKKAAAASKLTSAQSALDSAKTKLANADQAVLDAQAKVDAAQAALDTAKSNLDAALQAVKDSDAALIQQTQITNDAKVALDTAQTNLTAAASNLQIAQNTQSSAAANLSTKQTAYNNAVAQVESAGHTVDTTYAAYTQAHQTTDQAQAALQAAQAAYDNSSVPNPDYVAPTLTTETQTISNILYNSDFSQGTAGWSGVYAGWQGSSPGLFNGQIVFSYMNQTVSQGLYSGPFHNATLTLSADWYNNDSNRNQTDVYSMTVTTQDINHNPTGSATYNSTGRHDWENKSVTLVTTGDVSYITVSFTGVDSGFWYGDYGPHFRNPALSISHEVQTQGQAQPSAQQTGTISVDIGEGGQSTFTAPNGGTFVSADLAYVSYNDYMCGALVDASAFLGGSTITLDANNAVWGDTCGGQVKHLVGTVTYSYAQPEFIKDSSLLPAVQAAQTTYNQAQQAEQIAYSTYINAQNTYNQKVAIYVQAQQDLEAAQSSTTTSDGAATNKQAEYDAAQAAYETALATYNAEVSKLDSAKLNNLDKQTSYEASLKVYSSAQAAFTAATNNVDSVKAGLAPAHAEYDSAQANFESADTALNNATADEQSAQTDVTKDQDAVDIAQAELDALPPYVPPTPEEPKAPEIPAGDPKDLTTEEVTALVTQAEAVLGTAEQGSPEYNQALEALAVAAQADDPQVPTELLAVPLLGNAAAAVLDTFNALGNVGADMAPATREEAKKTVIASVIAAGAAVNAVQAATTAAAGAATTAAAATTSSSSSGSSSGGGGGGGGSSDSKPTRRTTTGRSKAN